MPTETSGNCSDDGVLVRKPSLGDQLRGERAVGTLHVHRGGDEQGFGSLTVSHGRMGDPREPLEATCIDGRSLCGMAETTRYHVRAVPESQLRLQGTDEWTRIVGPLGLTHVELAKTAVSVTIQIGGE
ncbi:MAG: hypothetical protein JRH17_19325, partial [Deltaproteobacteria bacterium]|nr:hypothetical protein [Deltaproteobacteria bacterium]